MHDLDVQTVTVKNSLLLGRAHGFEAPLAAAARFDIRKSIEKHWSSMVAETCNFVVFWTIFGESVVGTLRTGGGSSIPKSMKHVYAPAGPIKRGQRETMRRLAGDGNTSHSTSTQTGWP